MNKVQSHHRSSIPCSGLDFAAPIVDAPMPVMDEMLPQASYVYETISAPLLSRIILRQISRVTGFTVSKIFRF